MNFLLCSLKFRLPLLNDLDLYRFVTLVLQNGYQRVGLTTPYQNLKAHLGMQTFIFLYQIEVSTRLNLFYVFFFLSKSYLCLLLQFIDSYLAPEFLLHGIVDEKTDVFAFGVLLLELVTGRRALDYSQQSLVLWVSS